MKSKIFPHEWTQKEFLEHKNRLEDEGKKVLLIDTILSSIEKADSVVYNPFELHQEDANTIFVFYCDTGKTTLNRLEEYRKKFPKNLCVSLKGGKGYWRTNMQLLESS